MKGLQRKYVWYDDNPDPSGTQLKNFQFMGFGEQFKKVQDLEQLIKHLDYLEQQTQSKNKPVVVCSSKTLNHLGEYGIIDSGRIFEKVIMFTSYYWVQKFKEPELQASHGKYIFKITADDLSVYQAAQQLQTAFPDDI